MKLVLREIEAYQVVGLNLRVIKDAHRDDPKCGQQHQVCDLPGLKSCIDSIFMVVKGKPGYANGPIEKLAGLLLYRIAECQYFLDGNKRTALTVAVVFLGNNGHDLWIEEDRLDDLLAGIAERPARFKQEDAIQYIIDNIYPSP